LISPPRCRLFRQIIIFIAAPARRIHVLFCQRTRRAQPLLFAHAAFILLFATAMLPIDEDFRRHCPV